MTDLDAIHTALLDWAGGVDPDAICLLSMDTGEIITLHFMLALCQWILEVDDDAPVNPQDLGKLRKKVEGILVQAGYGGDPRP